jgi:ribosomal protein L31E
MIKDYSTLDATFQMLTVQLQFCSHVHPYSQANHSVQQVVEMIAKHMVSKDVSLPTS